MVAENSNRGKVIGSPELDRAISQLVTLYGAAAVRSSVRRLAKGKAGPPKIDDWSDLWQYVAGDPSAILKSTDFRVSNSAIAKRIAAAKPGHDPESTIRRLQRKLAKHRFDYAQALAALLASTDAPISTYVLLTKKLSFGKRASQFWRSKYEAAVKTREDYESIFGEAAPEVSYNEAKAKLSAYRSPERKGFGLGLPRSRQKCSLCGGDIMSRD
jgi:hypothetical protein